MNDYDAIVIGGGPAGSTASTLIAQAGRRVLQLERETFPRFKIGESLIPASNAVLARLGMIEKMRASHFPKKYSVQFFSGDGRASIPFYFSETEPEEQAQTWQVLRSEFDTLMLQNAREHGVEAHEGAQVKEVLFEGGRAVGVEVKLADGETRRIGALVIVDASGQRAIIGRQLGLRQPDPFLKMAAVFSHFEGAWRGEGIDEGATLVLNVAGKNGWFWYIPLPDDHVSVGVVGPIPYLIHGRGGDPQKVFDEEVSRCPALVPKLAGARQTMPIQVLNEFSYTSTRVAGDGWVLAGDAFAFLDPIYSTGVLLALRAGELAAGAVIEALEAGDTSAKRLGAHEEVLREGLRSFRGLVCAFYNRGFSFGGFLRKHPEHRLTVVKILVGDVFNRDFSTFYDDLNAFFPSDREPVPVLEGVA